MRRILTLTALIALFLTMALATGCGSKAEATAKCAGCGMDFPEKDAVVVDGKAMCPHCAEAAAKAEETAMHTCAKCGMKMAASEMVEQDDQWYCSHCAPAEKPAEMPDEHEGHDHG